MNGHRSVMQEEVLGLLARRPEGLAAPRLVDCTLGGGGHASALLEEHPEAELLGLDRDPRAVERCSQLLAQFRPRVDVQKADFRELARLIEKKNWCGAVGGIVADLGLSSFQLDDPERGFSFRHEGPLDMRMDDGAEVPTAADLLRTLSEQELAELFWRLGDESHSRRIASAIVAERAQGPLVTTRQLATLVESARPARRNERIHPATKVFQALRIAVNRELEGLRDFVEDAVDALAPGGRLVVISFHGGEDRAIKNALRDLAGRCTCPPELPRCACGRVKRVALLGRRPLMPSRREIEENPRSRSARLRAAEKLAA